MTAPPATCANQDRPLLGMTLMLGFCLLVPFSDALAKLLATKIAVGQIVFARFAAQAAILAPIALLSSRGLTIPRSLWRPLLQRTLLQMAGISAMFVGLRHLPLADAVAIAFVMPFIMLLLGKFALGENVGPHRIAACCVGFVGTLLVIQPSFALVGAPALWPLAVAVIFALFMLVTRQISRRIDPIRLQAASGVLACLLFAPIMAVEHLWPIFATDAPSRVDFGLTTLPARSDLMLLCLAGPIGTLAHLLMTWSLRYAPTTTLASMQYIEIPAAVVIGWLVFAQLPNGLATCGIALTLTAGLYAVWREARV